MPRRHILTERQRKVFRHSPFGLPPVRLKLRIPGSSGR